MVGLEKIEGKPQIGMTKAADGSEIPVAFCVQARETYVSVHEPTVRRGGFASLDQLVVRMTDGLCLTFIQNTLTGATSHHGRGGGTVVTYMPHFVVVGRSSIGADDKIDAVLFTVDDAESIFYDFDAFSIVLGAKDKLEEIVAEREPKIGRPIVLGEHPIIAYFTGKYEILSAETDHGKLAVEHSPSHGMGGPGGISIKNKIVLRLDLPKPARVADAIDDLMPHLRFLQLMAGRKQRIESLAVKQQGAAENDWHDLLWCLAWTRMDDEERGPHPADLPINGGIDPAEFSKVLTAWMNADEGRMDARVRFAQAFAQQRNYNIDRLVSAANMFDILPSNCFSKPEQLATDIATARDSAQKLFKALPKSDVRDRALGDLSRLDRLNLKAKVLQRASRLLAAAPHSYPGLEQVVRNAVDSRNHYVHGTDVTSAKAAFFRKMMSFHVDVLEYVFATSDLLDAGWDYDSWAKKGSSGSHPFGDFRTNYREMASRYMKEFALLKA